MAKRIPQSDQDFIDIYNDNVKAGHTIAYIAKLTGYKNERSVRRRRQTIEEKYNDNNLFYEPNGPRKPIEEEVSKKKLEFTPVQLPDEELDAETLVNKRIEEFENRSKALEARKLIPIKINVKGPFGITFFGDPHVDDDGCDIKLLKEHADMVASTEAMMAVNIGDTTNNWIGRLSRLWGEQGTSVNQAAVLAEWFINRVPWLCILLGNHDLWTGGKRTNMIAHVYRHSQYKGGVLEDWRARMQLNMPNGRNIIMNCAHDFAGHSMWNDVHGPLKASKMGWPDDNLLVCGHKHTSAYSWISGETKLTHIIRVAGYKKYDAYADKLGFPPQDNPSAMTAIIDPEGNAHNLITVFADPMEARDYLKFKRRKQ